MFNLFSVLSFKKPDLASNLFSDFWAYFLETSTVIGFHSPIVVRQNLLVSESAQFDPDQLYVYTVAVPGCQRARVMFPWCFGLQYDNVVETMTLGQPRKKTPRI